MQDATPSTGTAVHTRKCGCSTVSRRSTSTATFVEMKTNSSSRTTVSARVDRSPTSVSSIATTVVATIATHGVRRSGSTWPAHREAAHARPCRTQVGST